MTDAKGFRRWRKRQRFARPDLATRAYLVECDLQLLATPAGSIAAIRQLAQRNVAEFAAMLYGGFAQHR